MGNATITNEDASIELIAAMMTLLRASVPLQNLGVAKIYDRVPTQTDGSLAPTVTHPYISLGPSTSIPADYDCMDGEEITVQWDVWTNGDEEAFATVLCRKLCKVVKRTLHNSELALINNALVSLEWEMTRIVDDPNPAIGHGVVMFTATVETP